MNTFSHLHLHSVYSFYEGMSSLEDIFSRVEELGQTAVALTDKGNLCGIPPFFHLAKSYPEIKPIAGCEIIVERSSAILLAKDYKGYLNLCHISTEAQLSMKWGKPRVNRTFLASHSEGLICLSACTDGVIAQKITEGDPVGAEMAIDWYRKIFADDFYLEASPCPYNNPKNQTRHQTILDGIWALAADTGIKVIATNNVRFARNEQGLAYDCLCSLSHNVFFKDRKRLRSSGQEYIKSEQEMLDLFPSHPEAIFNTQEIVDKVERYEIDNSIRFPGFPLPKAYESAFEYLKGLALNGLSARFENNIPPVAKQRLDYELNVIKEKDCADYFLICSELVSWAKANGILMDNGGRWGASCRLINWCLGISEHDPFEFRLLADEFCNKDATDIPSIAIDVEMFSQAELVRHLEQMLGTENVFYATSFEKRIGLKDAARAFGLSVEETDNMTSLLPADIYDSTGRMLPFTIKNCLRYDAGFKRFYNRSSEIKKKIIDVAAELEGTIYATETDPSTIAIGEGASMSFLPKTKIRSWGLAEKNTVTALQYDRENLKKSGTAVLHLVRVPFLSDVKRCLSIIREKHGVSIDLSEIPFGDKKAMNIFREGDTDGIPQFDSPWEQEWLRELKPDSLEDLTTLYALEYSGLKDLIPDFVRRKHCGEKSESIIKEFEETHADKLDKFCRARSVSESITAWRIAYLKAHWPDEFEEAFFSQYS